MQGTDELVEWVRRVNVATADLERAREALAVDKDRRKDSIAARIGDWLTTTPAEAAERDAAERLDAIKAAAADAARNWVGETARTLLYGAPMQSAMHADQLQKVDAARTRLEQAQEWLRLAQDACERLIRAKRNCESASTTEFLDAVSKNKAFSLMSSIDASSARDSVRAAGAAVQALANALPKQSRSVEIDAPDDLLDFVLDIVFDPGLDVLSWMNMIKLDDAARQCSRAIDDIQPVRTRLDHLVSEEQDRFNKALELLRAIEAPFLKQAAELVPSDLLLSPPDSIPVRKP